MLDTINQLFGFTKTDYSDLVKKGAIIPMNNPNNNVNEIDKSLRTYEVYPFGKSSFTQYDDDGVTEAYKNGTGATTLIESDLSGDIANIKVNTSKGDFNHFVKEKTTIFKINVTAKPKIINVIVGGKKKLITEVKTFEAFN